MPDMAEHAKPVRRDHHLPALFLIVTCGLLEVWASWHSIGAVSGFPKLGQMTTGWILPVTTEAYWTAALYAWLVDPMRPPVAQIRNADRDLYVRAQPDWTGSRPPDRRRAPPGTSNRGGIRDRTAADFGRSRRNPYSPAPGGPGGGRGRDRAARGRCCGNSGAPCLPDGKPEPEPASPCDISCCGQNCGTEAACRQFPEPGCGGSRN